MYLSTEVSQALKRAQPVVALESTIITHGMPYPQNRDTALAVESAVRAAGAVPATIAVLRGELTIGISQDQLERLACTTDAMKLSRADLAFAIALEKTGSTTVAATMLAAHQAGITVFATGGIGGVHRGAERSFDISADLQELAQTDVTVICAGAKAILDLPKTLEVLETLGVPVLAYGQDELPAFWSRSSGLAAPLRVDNVKQIAQFLQARAALSTGGGVLICNPVSTTHEIPRCNMEVIIDSAINDANQAGIRGKAVTPWLLSRIFELTNGKSLDTNIQLIINNAALAAKLAVELARQQNSPNS